MLVPKVAARLAWAVAGAAAHRSRAARIAALGVLIGLLVGVGVAQRSPAAPTRAPSAPSRLTARADANAVHLRWRAPARGRVTRYRLERGGTPIARVGRTRRSYTDGRVRPGRAYGYVVRALGRAGTRSRASRAVWVTVPAPAAGALPTGVSAPAVAPAVSPTGSNAPTADLPGWRHVFADDFSVPTQTFPGSAYAAAWWAYPSGWTDTSGSVGRPAAERGHYDCAKTCSVSSGLLTLNLHSEAGTPYVAAPVPRLPGSSGGVDSTPSGQLYGRYSVRFRATVNGPGYKTAWLLWPDSGNWPRDGEIDYPEGSLDGGFAGFVHHQGATSGSDQTRVPSSGSAGGYAAWHEATIEWSPGRVEFLLDGASIGAVTARVPATSMHWVLQSETEVTATPTPDTSTAVIEIDWVSVWKRA
jgi:glycosyl hydrolase family 16/fibronectin type III domain protein